MFRILVANQNNFSKLTLDPIKAKSGFHFVKPEDISKIKINLLSQKTKTDSPKVKVTPLLVIKSYNDEKLLLINKNLSYQVAMIIDFEHYEGLDVKENIRCSILTTLFKKLAVDNGKSDKISLFGAIYQENEELFLLYTYFLPENYFERYSIKDFSFVDSKQLQNYLQMDMDPISNLVIESGLIITSNPA